MSLIAYSYFCCNIQNLPIKYIVIKINVPYIGKKCPAKGCDKAEYPDSYDTVNGLTLFEMHPWF